MHGPYLEFLTPLEWQQGVQLVERDVEFEQTVASANRLYIGELVATEIQFPQRHKRGETLWSSARA